MAPPSVPVQTPPVHVEAPPRPLHAQPGLRPSARRMWPFVLLLLAVTAGALALRLPKLDLRPMHTDEAVHADKLGTLLDEGRYIYNPHEYHGPTIYYFTLPLLWLRGVHHYAEIPNEVPLRLVPALFGAGLILLLMMVMDGLGRRATLVAGVLTALSPAMVFYSRYYIQEMLFIFFTFATIAAGWRYTRTKHFGWALLAGLSLGLMHATKETCVIAYACMGGAAFMAAIWSGWVDGRPLRLRDYFHKWHLAGTVQVAAVVALLCLSAFLTNPKGTLDAVRAYAVYLGRGSSGDSSTNGMGVHNHPWFFYLKILTYYHNGAGPWWSEGLIVALALMGIYAVLRPQHRLRFRANIHLLRFLAFYTILMTTVYSAIPYKTPWCLLGFLHGMILMAGLGTMALWRRLPRWTPHHGMALTFVALLLRAGVLLALLAGGWNLGAQAWRGSFKFNADPRNPYVYGHTGRDILRLAKRAEDIAKVHPAGHKMVIKMFVPGSDYWPLPWYLRRFSNIGYYTELPEAPEEYAPGLIIAGPKLVDALEARLKGKYQGEYYGLRPEVLLYGAIPAELWEKYLNGQTKTP